MPLTQFPSRSYHPSGSSDRLQHFAYTQDPDRSASSAAHRVRAQGIHRGQPSEFRAVAMAPGGWTSSSVVTKDVLNGCLPFSCSFLCFSGVLFFLFCFVTCVCASACACVLTITLPVHCRPQHFLPLSTIRAE